MRTDLQLIAISFVRDLLEEDPRQRLTLEGALHHSWLHPLWPAYQDSLVPDSSTAFAPEEGPMSYYDDQPYYDPPIFDQGQLDESFGKISLRKLSMIPGAFYDGSQNMDAYAERAYSSLHLLDYRAVQLNEQDPEGNMQSWELVRPDAREGERERENATPRAAGAGDEASREGEQIAVEVVHDSDSSLTPVSDDDEDDGSDGSHAAPQAGVSRPVRSGGVPKTRASAGKGKAKAATGAKTANVRTSGDGAATRRTRASNVRDQTHGRDIDEAMDVEQSGPQARGVRHSARLASPQKNRKF